MAVRIVIKVPVGLAGVIVLLGEDRMGLGEWFSEFCGNLQIKNGSTISGRYQAITRRLNTDFWLFVEGGGG